MDGHARFVDATGSLDDTIASHESALSELAATIRNPSSAQENNSGARPPDEALESHEVIELQAFSDRKEWIVEKTKFLESLPPVEVFAGLNSLRAQSDNPPSIPSGLPTREQLQEWMKEHDRIEKETEIFDSGELRKLKQLTKAAAKRNLSPEDTDLIELALITIFELDKLFHLLRDRSESLELLSVRLTWEECRVAAWNDLSTVVRDLNTFLSKRVRWSPSAYDDLPSVPSQTPAVEPPTPPPYETRFLERRSSINSLSSASTDAARLNRASRFKHVEQLTKDAAQLGARLTSLRNGNVLAAGKALDKLIDTSRREVPEELLDEQDRLELKGITELEGVGKYLMSMVTQWKKADEFYVETLKDQTSAKILLDDIETARLAHPTSRQNTAFATRTAALLKRITTRGDPNLNIPRPSHLLFPEQQTSTTLLIRTLVEERTATLDAANAAKRVADEYSASFEAVQRVDKLVKSATGLNEELDELVERLKTGTSVADGDGSPPDLTTPKCLDPLQHQAFLALMPSTLEQLEDANNRAETVLSQVPAAMLQVQGNEVDPEFRSSATLTFRELSSRKAHGLTFRDDLGARVGLLRDARKVWSAIQEGISELEGIRQDVWDGMERDRWVPQTSHGGLPPTPESTQSATLAVSSTPTPPPLDDRLNNACTSLSLSIEAPLSEIAGKMPPPLHAHLTKSAEGLHALLDSLENMHRIWERVKAQSSVMREVQDEAYDLQIRAEEIKSRLDERMQQVLSNGGDAGEALDEEVDKLRQDVTSFTEGLSSRVPFVAPAATKIAVAAAPKRRTQSVGLRTDMLLEQPEVQMPFHPTVLDGVVRTDCNRLALLLAGDVASVQRKRQHLDLACQAVTIDGVLNTALNDIVQTTKEIEEIQASVRAPVQEADSLQHLASLDARATDLEEHHCRRLSRAFSDIQKLHYVLDTSPSSHDAEVHNLLMSSRREAIDSAKARFDKLTDRVAAVRRDIQTRREAEERLAEERRLAAEQARVEAEERARIEALRIEEERVERERLENERREQERLEAERIEYERLEQERLKREYEEQERLELERQMKERLEQEKLEHERTERERLEREAAEEERLKIEQLEKELREKEILEQQRLENERLERQRLEQEQLAKKREEDERREKQRLEQERAEYERREKERKIQEELEAARLEQERLQQALNAERLARDHLQEELRLKDKQEQERLAHKRTESVRLESERLERERLDQERMKKEQLERAHLERSHSDRELLLKKQLDQGRLEREALEQAHREQERRNQELLTRERAARQELEKQRLAMDRQQTVQKQDRTFPPAIEDVFGLRVAPSSSSKLTPEMSALQAKVQYLRRQLASMNLHSIVRPTRASSPLPDEELFNRLDETIAGIATGVSDLPGVDEPVVHTEIQSLHADLTSAREMLTQVRNLVSLSQTVRDCDALMSDLLEHVDSYPAPPSGPLSSSFAPSLQVPPEEQMESRLSHTRNSLENLAKKVTLCKGDARAVTEQERLMQTWSELEDMATERLHGIRSRPSSVLSTVIKDGRDSRLSSVSRHSVSTTSLEPLHENPASPPQRTAKNKKFSFAGLGSGPAPKRTGLLSAPAPPATARRVSSGQPGQRSSSRLSRISDTRSVSNPAAISSFSARLTAPTISSKQRSSSSTSNAAKDTPARDKSKTPSRRRAQTNQASRPSPSPEPCARFRSQSVLSNARSSTPQAGSANQSTWSRAPRISFTSVAGSSTSHAGNNEASLVKNTPKPQTEKPPFPKTLVKSTRPKSALSKRKPYVPNPKNKLDVAVGEVVNKLPVQVDIEVAEPLWKDNSGKYWIGVEEPKLCYCRILRSQTVMVRVGGGWQSLEKFIQLHFADQFRILPESPPRHNSIRNQQEKWISSATLLENQGSPKTPPRAPRTPEPGEMSMPKFAFSPPKGVKSPHSLKGTPGPGSPGSPLAALQFMRRADQSDVTVARPSTPTKPGPSRGRQTTPALTNNQPLVRSTTWRP